MLRDGQGLGRKIAAGARKTHIGVHARPGVPGIVGTENVTRPVATARGKSAIGPQAIIGGKEGPGREQVVARRGRLLRWRGCGRKAQRRRWLDLPRNHVLLDQTVDLAQHILLLLDRVHHHLEAGPRRRRRGRHLGRDAIVGRHKARNLCANCLALLAWRIEQVLIERCNVGCNLLRARQKARAHGSQRTFNVVVNGLRLIAHLL
jgi:hypothetical protein